MIGFFKEMRDSNKVVQTKFDILFYAENAYYFQYFRHLFEVFTDMPEVTVGYITSDRNDPVLSIKREGLQTFYLHKTLVFVFSNLQAKVVLLTMPDLQNFAYKRSAGVGKYVYIFHALVSIHQQYRQHAFNHYDAFFCCGPHHLQELEKLEEISSLSSKDKIAYGYPLLEELKHKVPPQDEKGIQKILIAPSWYEQGILNTCLLPLLNVLLSRNWLLYVRPHPEYIKRNKKEATCLLNLANQHDSLAIDFSPKVYTHLVDADVLITDRSGIALEYAFACNRPVVFLNTPPKINNPAFESFSIIPVENSIRTQIGIEVETSGIKDILKVLDSLETSEWKNQITEIESSVIFDSTHWINGVNYIKKALGKL
ncbi:MAG: hypothetical protein JWP69_24 [Flaviaesturariibacter sp.]|nr:hypothetical protein [Flaviaesturariibacter sp.]